MSDNIDAKKSFIPEGVKNFREAQIMRRQREKRPEKPTDVAERKQVFYDTLETVDKIPPNLPLRFHGCHSYDLEEIARSGSLQSGVDITGENTSFDIKGSISVTSPSTIIDTLGDLEVAQRLIATGKEVKSAGYIDILDKEVPLGCTFILMPANEVDAQRGENGGNVMDNVDLHSSSFVGLLTSSEFIDRAKGIMILHGLDPNRVIKYEELPQALPKITEKVRIDFPYTGTYKPQVAQSGFSINI